MSRSRVLLAFVLLIGVSAWAVAQPPTTGIPANSVFSSIRSALPASPPDFNAGTKGDWLAGDASNVARMDNGVATDGQLMWSIGGYPGLDSIEVYDPTAGSWTTLTAASHTLDLTVAAVSLDGGIYVIAGAIDGTNTPNANTFMVYDIGDDAWDDTLADVPGEGTWGAQLVALDGYIYKIGGGAAPADSSATVHQYDPDTDTWTAMASLAQEREFFCAYAYDGQIYVVGGVDATNAVYASGEIYDPGTNTWSDDSESLPEGRWGMACGQAGPTGSILIIGAGVNPSWGLVTNSYIRDLAAKDSWTELGTVPTPVYRTAGAVVGLSAYIVNGSTGGFSPTTAVQYNDTIWDGCYIDGLYLADGETNPDNVCEICTVAESVDEWSSNDDVDCDDGLWCNGDDTCQSGVCEHEMTAEERCPSDDLFCTGDEICDEDADACDATGDPCEDDEVCNEDEDSCDPLDDDDDDDDTAGDDDDDDDDDGCGC